MTLQVLVVGSGQRVRRAALPALLSRPESFTIAGVWSRKPKQIFAEDKSGSPSSDAIEVTALAQLTSEDIAAIDLVYICVSKAAVPQVLAQLAGLIQTNPGKSPNLLIDTPVLLFKHMAAARHFAAFGQVWVAEDMSTLPWLDSLNLAVADLGARKKLLLDRSAFAYHGVALAKTLLDSQQLVKSRRKRVDVETTKDHFERLLHFAGGEECLIMEPRDYSQGGFRLACNSGTIADPGAEELEPEDMQIICRFESGRCTGFDVSEDGKVEPAYSTNLAPHEIELLGNFPVDANGKGSAGPIAHMDAMKRVGFARLLDRIAAQEPLWTLQDGLDDMWIDYLTEKTGRWRATPLTSARSSVARRLVGLAMSAALKIKS